MTRNISSGVVSDVRRLRETLRTAGRRGGLRDPFFASCESLQLTPPQFHSLFWLGLEAPLSMSALSQRLGISVKTMTGIIDRLERQGRVRRGREAADRRVVTVRLTPAGQTVFRRLDRSLEQSLGRLLSFVSASDRRLLLGLLERLVARMGSAASSSPQSSRTPR